MKPVFVILFVVVSAAASATTLPYGEPYRPQYHFTPKQGWIGDPDGLVRYRGEYHLFWWGHAVSPDLVYWKELPWPMTGDDDSFMYYSGSAVIDVDNTGGWGTSNQPAMVAVYTAHERASGLENQRVSISTNYASFRYYDDNPVLNLNSRSFRDPDVFWYGPGRSWIMAIALPDDRKVQFYASSDLKTWRYLSSFGPAASQIPLWETPNLFPLPLNGDTNDMRWILTCSLGPNKMQYFVGNFDGRSFRQDPLDAAYLTSGQGLDGVLFEDFEGRTLGQWVTSGDAFERGPVHATTPGQPAESGFLGRGVGSSSASGDERTGNLRSPVFTIEHNCINFLIGGGNYPRETCINLLVSGQVVRTSTGRNSEAMIWSGWDVSPWKGQQAQISIYDDRTDEWGHIDVDQIIFSDALFDTGREHANWIDWGQDFYAARIYRDYDDAMTSTVWLGWMGNWDYANRLPMSWGQGALSIPREISLVTSPNGYVLVQKPLAALEKLRGKPVALERRRVKDTMAVKEFRPSRNAYELAVEFEMERGSQVFGINFCVGGKNKVVLAYDVPTSTVTLDRTSSGNVSFSDQFPSIATATLYQAGRTIKFHVFVDQSSIEVFVNDGQVVLTSQIFPDARNTGVEVFCHRGEATMTSLKAWELSSIWEPVNQDK